MSTYIGGVAIAALAVSLALHLAHEEMRGVTRIALGLLVILTVAAPVADLARELSEGDLSFGELPSVEEGDPAYADVARRAFEEGVGRAVADELGISADDVEVGCDGFDFSGIRAERIYVTLSGRGAFGDSRAVKDFVESSFGGRCVVEIEIG